MLPIRAFLRLLCPAVLEEIRVAKHRFVFFWPRKPQLSIFGRSLQKRKEL